MTRPPLRTERLRLEPLTRDHLDHLLALDADAEVMRFITGRALTSGESVADYLPRRLRSDADARGLGYWVGFDRVSGDFTGWWCLAVDDDDGTAAELGYRLTRDSWGRGLATEGARALLAHGFETVGLERIWAQTMSVNAGSRSVMAKLGMPLVRSYVGTWDEPLPGADEGEVVHALTAAQWRAVQDWDAEAAAFDDEPDHGLGDPEVRERWRALLHSVLPPAPVTVADLGCGTGTLSALLAGEGYRVTGVDLSPRMLDLARAKVPDASFLVGDAAVPPLPEAAFDVVLCRHVLWALPDPVDALRRWVTLLRPQGRLVLIEGRWWTGGGLTAERTGDLLAEAGRTSELHLLDDPGYWGRDNHDERYLYLSTH